MESSGVEVCTTLVSQHLETRAQGICVALSFWRRRNASFTAFYILVFFCRCFALLSNNYAKFEQNSIVGSFSVE